MFAPDRYVEALRFAAQRHADKGQLVPGTSLPYTVHITSVAVEVIAVLPDSDLAVMCALLHDVLEDTTQKGPERDAVAAAISERFGAAVAAGVWALTKDEDVAKPLRMADSLRRIREQPHDVWAVKLADRITNLAPPPAHWTAEKRAAYRKEAIEIADALGAANATLHARIRAKIDAYDQ
jgi:(p)ppGpp synthase/HD superfamily hydrolase